MKSNTVLITGASGLLGNYLSKYFLGNNYNVVSLRKNHSLNLSGVEEIEIELLDFAAVKNLFNRVRPKYVIHCAGLTNVDECEKNESLAKKIHVDLSQLVAQISVELDIKMIHISTDHLWDGTKAMIKEDTPFCPLNVYGKTKAEAELAVLSANPKSLILRTNFFGPGLKWRQSFSDWIINSLNRNEKINAFADVFFTPISIFHLSDAILKLIQKQADGVYHVVGGERISKFEFAVLIAKTLDKSINLINPISIKDVTLYARRPLDMSLSAEKIQKLFGQPMSDIRTSIATLNN
ncbi:SDR family oxidoreductase [Leptospira noguchii]|uniref:SDR family oxidoreductase n=1 Tax=Leptospira noguchii TaxID=28182 RepID=UPI000305FC0C|nr:SDR family oxidoreductase [Leptospira noguchii]UOG47563.1 SDR family oxidoreductase [Leptospira noguchii]